jgi:hypothetical protein
MALIHQEANAKDKQLLTQVLLCCGDIINQLLSIDFALVSSEYVKMGRLPDPMKVDPNLLTENELRIHFELLRSRVRDQEEELTQLKKTRSASLI